MNIALIFAGGVGSRMNMSDIPKQFLEVEDKPILMYTLEIFENNDNIDAIVIPCVESHIEYCKELVEKFDISKVKRIIPGGATAQESIMIGLRNAKEISNGNDDIVLIHDGVRPLIKSETIDDNIEIVKQHGNAITCAKCKETILVSAERNMPPLTVNREKALIARAPQSFFLEDIFTLSERALDEGINVIDCCTMLEVFGISIYTVMGPEENIKITTQDDFIMFRSIIAEKSKL